ncbi:MAG: sugar isomerase domain-containing protein [Armatimonadota bacterium]
MPDQTTPAFQYLRAARELMDRVEATQTDAILQCARMCGESILQGGLVHMFGAGHSRMALEEMFPRYGSFPGFHPIVELSVTFHNQVVGANGQRQAMFIEQVEGLGRVVLRNFEFGPHDLMWVVSTSGAGAMGVDVALEAKRLGMPVIALIGVEHCRVSEPRHSSGQKLTDIADLVLDNCAVPGDSLVHIEGLKYPVGPGSTIGNTLVINAVKCEVARILTEGGQPPYVLTHSHFIGAEASKEVFDLAYDDYRRRVRRL